MARQTPADKDARGFEANLEACSDELRQMVAYLRKTAQNAGADVTERRFKHTSPNTGWGITYYAGGNGFCDFHPKRQRDHVWALIHGGDRVALETAGTVAVRGDGPWVTIENMRGAVRLVPFILRAHDDLVGV